MKRCFCISRTASHPSLIQVKRQTHPMLLVKTIPTHVFWRFKGKHSHNFHSRGQVSQAARGRQARRVSDWCAAHICILQNAEGADIAVEDPVGGIAKGDVDELQHWGRQLAHVREVQLHRVFPGHRLCQPAPHLRGANQRRCRPCKVRLSGLQMSTMVKAALLRLVRGAPHVRVRTIYVHLEWLMLCCGRVGMLSRSGTGRGAPSSQGSSLCSAPGAPAWRCRGQIGRCTPAEDLSIHTSTHIRAHSIRALAGLMRKCSL